MHLAIFSVSFFLKISKNMATTITDEFQERRSNHKRKRETNEESTTTTATTTTMETEQSAPVRFPQINAAQLEVGDTSSPSVEQRPSLSLSRSRNKPMVSVKSLFHHIDTPH